MKSTLFLFCLILTAFAGIARADIYRLDSDDETISFTDAPNDKRFQLVMKEPRGLKPGKNRQKITKTASTPENNPPSEDSGLGNRDLPVQGRITSVAGFRDDPIDGKLRHHNGLDIAAPTGTPVKPVASGTVIFSGWKPGYGNTVVLEHDDGMTTVYAHHSSNNVSEGTQVNRDTVIALTGSTGRSTGPHLHFEAWRNGINITPEFMPGNAASAASGTLASAPINRYLQADGTIVFTNLR